jgi:hypothetical protein
MKKKTLLLTLIFLIPLLFFDIKGNAMTGSGTSIDPFVITTCLDLQNMSSNLNATYILGSDIDCSMTNTWNSGAGFIPIGNTSTLFNGTLDGKNYSINGLFINRSSTGNQGLFGKTNSSTTIKNLNLTNVNITGYDYTGGLIGYAFGNISNVHVSGSVKGRNFTGGIVGTSSSTITASSFNGTITGDNTTGGLVGTQSGQNVSTSYASGSITCTNINCGGLFGILTNSHVSDVYANIAINSGTFSNIGGLIGNATFTSGTYLKNSYSTSFITGSGINTGGLIGLNNDASYVTNCYWEKDISSRNYSAGGTGLSTLQMKNQINFSGWDFTSIWSINSSVNNGYPTLQSNNSVFSSRVTQNLSNQLSFEWNSASGATNYQITKSGTVIYTGAITTYSDTSVSANTIYTYVISAYDDSSNLLASTTLVVKTKPNMMVGWGWSNEPYIIKNINDLQSMNNDLTSYYILGNDIDASVTSGWNSGQGFIPIGNSTSNFKGTLDGQNHIVSNLTINQPTTNYIGLFGAAYNATFKNITLQNAAVSGKQFTGSLAAYVSSTTITNIQTSGTVTGAGYYVGGLAGQTIGSTISNSSSSATITMSGQFYIGGLIGMANSSSITNCFATGNINGTNSFHTGGLIGYVTSTNVNYSYATGSLSSVNSTSGGLIGSVQSSSTITNSYATGNVSGTNTNYGGFIGYVTNSIVSNNYAFGNVNGNTNVGGFVGYIDTMSGSNAVNKNYSIGTVTGGIPKGGFVGAIKAGYETYAYDNYWDINTSGISTSPAGIGQTTPYMKIRSTYLGGWDFTNTWGTLSTYHNGYPYIRYFGPTPDDTPASEISNITNTIYSDKIVFNWNNPGDSDYASTYVYRNGVKLTSFISSGTFTDTGLTPGSTYTYKFTTLDSSGNESNGKTITLTTGSLSITAPLANNFPNYTIGTQETLTTNFSSPLVVNDTTNYQNGWNLTVSASQFTQTGGTGYTFPKGVLRLKAPISGAPSIVGSPPWVIDGNNPIQILSASSGTFFGTTSIVFPNDALQLSLDPSYVRAGNPYQSVITWTVAMGP